MPCLVIKTPYNSPGEAAGAPKMSCAYEPFGRDYALYLPTQHNAHHHMAFGMAVGTEIAAAAID